MSAAYETLLARIREIGQLEAVESLLDWDQETYMPPQGLHDRAEQLSLVARMIHDRRIDPQIGELLSQCDGEGDEARQTNVRETRRLYERGVRVPSEIIGRIARVAAHAKAAWQTAKANDHFPTFAPHLTELLQLKREIAERIGYADEPYDALLDEFEPGARTAEVAAVFSSLRDPLAGLLRDITQAPKQPDVSILQRHYPRDAQEAFARHMSAAVGFDYQRGRLDISVHPFCSGNTPNDVRLTTRYQEDWFPGALFGVLHESGHGVYEQGLDAEHVFTPRGAAVSLGIHESQSRLWENMVGRSRPFWEHYYQHCQQTFPRALSDVSLDAFVHAVNVVRPSYIRVEADEVTYNLHIVLRFELERDMIQGKLAVNDVPDAWNTKFREMLGITPPDDAHGCLQDIHWSMGTFGYFPTYALGNLFAAQFFAAAQNAMPDLDDMLRAGDLQPLLEWLQSNIYRHGQRYRANELVKVVTGQPLTIDPFMKYVRTKFGRLYGFA